MTSKQFFQRNDELLRKFYSAKKMADCFHGLFNGSVSVASLEAISANGKAYRITINLVHSDHLSEPFKRFCQDMHSYYSCEKNTAHADMERLAIENPEFAEAVRPGSVGNKQVSSS